MQTPDKRKYSLRLREAFSWYDTLKTQMFHTWPAGTVVTDPTEIEILESAHAQTERIYEGEFRR